MKNKILLLISLFLFASQAFAQSADQFYTISDFSGMLKSHVDDHLIAKNAAKEALNVRGNDVYGNLSKRAKRFLLSNCHSSPVKSLYRFYKSSDTAYLIQTSSTFADYIDDTTGTCTEIQQSLSDGKRWTWVTYKDIAIGTNGTNLPKKWDGKTQTTANTDGSRTANDLFADLGAPFAEQNTGSNLDASSWYQYKVAFYDGSVYKYSTARSNPILTGSTVRDITLTDIPLGPTGTTSRILYRTVGDASRAAVLADATYYKVATISDNSTRTYNDAIADATIVADAAPTWATVSAGTNVTPPYSKFALIHQERLFLANDPSGTTSGKSTIYWSDVFNPDYFNTATDYELIRPDDGDEITVLADLYGILTIGKTNTWQKLYTDAASTADWSVSSPFSFVGCPAPYTAINTIGGILFLGRFGIYNFNGQSAELVSDTVTDQIRDILQTNFLEAVATYQSNQYLLSYTSSESGSGTNDRVLLLDMVRNSYVEDSENIDSWAVFSGGSDFGTLYSGSSNTDGSVYAHSGDFYKLIYRYKSQFSGGTTGNTVIFGDEEEPSVCLGWDETWSTVAGTWAAQGSKTWLLESLSGTWTSPIININAAKLDKIYWNESLGSYGDITWAIRTGATTGAVSAASWSSEYSTPTGSDISALTADAYIQLRASFSSSVWTEAPCLTWENSYVMKMTYQKEGTTGESSILSIWKSNKTDFEVGPYPKRIKEIQVFYKGTSGTLNLAFDNGQANGSQNFNINLSIDPSSTTTDQYYGTTDEKIYDYFPPVDNSMVGRDWQLTVTESGAELWSIEKIIIRYEVNPYVPYR